jgi:hypothetical protein
MGVYAGKDTTKFPPRKGQKKYGKRHSAATRLGIAAMVEAGMTKSKIALSSGVSESAVYSVMKDPRFKILNQREVTAIKDSLLGLTYQTGLRAEMAISDEKLQQSSALQLKTISAISIDKGRLMSGESTANLSHGGLIGTLDSDRQKLMDRLNALDGEIIK